MLQNKAEMLQLPGTTPVLSVLRATLHSKDPVMGFLEALNSNSPWQNADGIYIIYILLHTNCLRDFPLQILLQVDFQMFAQILKKLCQIKLITSYTAKEARKE